MTELFSVEWVDGFGVALGPGAVDGSLDRVVEVTVLGGPEGDLPVRVAVGGGAVRRAEATDLADLSLTIPWNDALAVLDGRTTPALAYMQGKLKGSGDMALLLDLLRGAATDRFRSWREAATAAA